ncbi:excinuclease ABC subunit UvrA [Chitinophaga silvatica]|uniref:UvrABC system protein A n=1 Tax=Chitinophaga silvatica TaxID=2282649 RepID=A0A3E1Y2I8_9BACT|nr:excinuclease ABC subunit UvrA [Chitinophaga silvatica]RFS18863.1 excinuclease ABC subunit UvrA [Chitinophaga silvatica]
MKNIIITGARQNNLKNISLELPKNQITVFTGVSGSGKSSLVFLTIGAEAQRQINETHNSFVRNRLTHLGIADVDKIENLNVPIIINQQKIGGNARSTVGTVTDIYAQLRLLYSRIGQPFVGYSNIFSFNNPAGMCPECEGLGYVQSINLNKLIDKSKSLNEGAIRFPTFQPGGWRLTRYTQSGYFDNDKILKDYSKQEWDLLLYAKEHKPAKPSENWGKTVLYEGIIPRIEKAFLKKDSKETDIRKDTLSDLVTAATCPVCNGQRLNEKVLSCKIQGKNIADCCSMAIDDLQVFLKSIHAKGYETLLQELIKRLQNLITIGLQYLTLNRTTATLSGGESQRIKMVKQLSNSLIDLLYILDEPSVGLHPADVDNIINIIKQIRDKGNTVLVVEHDPDIISIADHIVDMGPEAGKQGGQIVYQGTFSGLKNSAGKTGRYFHTHPTYNQHPKSFTESIQLSDASMHNLKDVSVSIPLSVLTVVTGVAGSGKSTLISEVLPNQHPYTKVIDQSPIIGSIRSTLLTYLGVADQIRRFYAEANHVNASLFSNNSEGACLACNGTGIQKIDLAFMDDIEQVCDVCDGSGFNPEMLKYTYRGKNIVELMQLTVLEAIEFFDERNLLADFETLTKLGLHYITLGQRLSSFSGGERQRLKLSKELKEQPAVLVLDEPSTGLHPSDTAKLLQVMHELVDAGNTLIVIEHNLDIISQADWIIDMGPGAGKYGGKIVFEGTVAALLQCEGSITGRYLNAYLRR